MEKYEKGLIIALGVAVILAFVFCGMWISGKQESGNVEMICYVSAENCLAELEEHMDSGDTGAYWRGVAEFRAFSQSFLTLMSGISSEYNWYSELYVYLTAYPERGMENVELFAKAMDAIAEEPYGSEGPVLLEQLYEIIKSE